jgi:hypothetical protein
MILDALILPSDAALSAARELSKPRALSNSDFAAA